MGLFITLVFLVIGGTVAILLKSSASDLAKDGLERDRKMELWEAEKRKLEQFLAHEHEGWRFLNGTKIDGHSGLIALDERGISIRLATFDENADVLAIVSDERLPVSSIKSISVSQPTKSKTVVHVDQTPVAVQANKKSPGGRALVGAVVAGPIGAIVGAATGLSNESKIELHQTRRSQEITVRDPAVLIIGTSDFKRPTIRLAFGDNTILNQWSSRLWAARGW